MLEWKDIKKWFNRESSSKDVAKDRLKLVLVQDRSHLSTDIMDQLRDEILEVIQKYVEINDEELHIELTRKEDEKGATGALIANIGIKGMRRVRESSVT